ncbi:MAG: hypothetical protein H0T42_10250 [Deltaproteobacteria bacterium]|nr:hypothetical protein [Deltaproteobacteria bacterium]
MSTGDDTKHSRETLRFDSATLAALKKVAGDTWQQPVPATEAEALALLAASRTATVDDPMTMAVLAETARSQAREVDPAAIEAAIAEAEAAAAPTPPRREPPHPNLKRRVP